MRITIYSGPVEVVFRADATRAVGAGHVMRCWALAEELQARGAKIAWHGRFDVPWIHQRLAASGWRIENVTGSDVGPAVAAPPDVVVVDSYSLDWGYRTSLASRGIPVVAVIDDSHPGAGPGSLWVNPGITVERPEVDSRAYLNGPDYVLIRSDIRALREVRAASGPSTRGRRTIAVLLGGTDFAGLATTAVSIVDELDDTWSVVAGPGAGPANSRIKWLAAGAELLRRAALADVVISPAGVSSWELLHIGVPLALVLVTENQRGNYEWLTRNGFAIGIGSPENLAPKGPPQLMLGALSDLNARVALGVDLVDGLGAVRVANAIEGIL